MSSGTVRFQTETPWAWTSISSRWTACIRRHIQRYIWPSRWYQERLGLVRTCVVQLRDVWLFKGRKEASGDNNGQTESSHCHRNRGCQSHTVSRILTYSDSLLFVFQLEDVEGSCESEPRSPGKLIEMCRAPWRSNSARPACMLLVALGIAASRRPCAARTPT